MEAVIAWLVQTILATLLIDKLDAWIRQAGLANDIEKLKSEIQRVKRMVGGVHGRAIGNESLAEALARVKELLYEADDVVNELDYYRLQHQLEGVDKPDGIRGAERVSEIPSDDGDTPMNSSVGKLRSMVWEHFTITEKYNGRPIKAICKECEEEFKCDTKVNGTSSMKKHLKNEHSVTCTKRPGAPHLPNLSSTSEPIAIGSPSRRKGKKRRSKAWHLFYITEDANGEPIKARCKYCPTKIKCGGKNGTAGMLNHNKICKNKPGPNDQPTNPSSTGDASENVNPIVIGDPSNRKRRRPDEESIEIMAVNTHTPWDKTILSNMIQKITSQLQDIRGQVTEFLTLHGLDLASSSNHHRSTALDQHLRTSSLVPRKVYGRDAEKDSVIKMITEERSDGVVVLPIVGIAGVGKTTLAQLVYNDRDVETQFDQRIWVWVSRNFDEVKLTREMLESISGERHAEINSFAKLQEILKGHANSKRLLLILDYVWDDLNDIQWDKMLAPLVSSHVKGSVVLVTTRNMTVAQRLGTLKPVKLDALANDDFWLLFKSCAFGYENYEEHESISIIGRKIAEKLKGNPLAAVSTGELLRKKHNTDYWRNILKNEDWKSMQLSRGIMTALRLSYDQLPYHLQQCFSHCSIFPDSYQFLIDELVGFWIAQRFVKCSNSSQSLEGIGRCYLIELVNLGFLQEVKREGESYLGRQILYAVCGIMHDFATMVSRDDCAIIAGLQCNKMPQTLRHLSIVTGSTYKEDKHGNIHRDKKFEENLKNAVTSVSKLRTLVLLGNYDSYFLLLFQDIFQKAHNLRVLQMSATSADFLKCGYDEVDGALPQVLSKLYHLQVLNVGSYTDPTVPDGISNLVSLQNLVVHKGVYSSIATFDSITSFQEPHGIKFQISSGFEITQFQSTDESVQHWMHVKTLEEAYEAGLRNNEMSEKLFLSWKESISRLEPRQDVKDLQISGYDATWFSSLDSCISTSFQTVHIYHCEKWKILPSLGRFPFLAKLILSCLEKVIEVLVPSLEELILFKMPRLERCSCTSVEGMNSRLRALQIEECYALKEFDLFKNDGTWLPGLRKLILCDCPNLEVLKPFPHSTTVSELLVRRVSTLPSMEVSSSERLTIGSPDKDGEESFDKSSDELTILDDKILAFHNLTNLKSMRIEGCRNLACISFKGFSHLVSLKSLEISICRQLFSSDVMPEHTFEDGSAANGKAFPSLKSLSIASCGITGKWLCLLLKHAPDLEKLDLCEEEEEEQQEEEQNGQQNRISPWEDSSSGKHGDALTGLAQDRLVHFPLNLISSLKKISIDCCPRLTFNLSEEGFSVFTSLQELKVLECPKLFSSLVHKEGNDDRANGRCLVPTSLEEFVIDENYDVKALQPCFPSDLTNLKKLEVFYCPALESLQLRSCVALEELTIKFCYSLTALEGLQSLPSSLETLDIYDGWYLSSLRKLEVCDCPALESLQLRSCVALEELIIRKCESLTTLEGLHFLGSLRHLELSKCPGLPPWLESFSRQGYELCSRLETLKIDDPSVLTTSVCECLTSLRRLKLESFVLSEEQGRALMLLKSLQHLEFIDCRDLSHLPAGPHLPSLKKLEIRSCSGISRLPETGLPLSLEEMEIDCCSKELADQCRALATSKLDVKISHCCF